MILEFQRIGQRGYAVIARRFPLPDLEMNPAPGFDPLMPHDMLHLVVESQLGLTQGIFGQLAAGGDAGTFHPIRDSQRYSRANSRLRSRIRARGKTLLRKGRNDSAQSERAVYMCWQEWRARSQHGKQTGSVGATKGQLPLNENTLEKICEHLDKLSSRWSQLKVGQSMAVTWPDLTVSESQYFESR